MSLSDGQRKAAQGVTGAVVVLLLQQFIALAQRVTALETAQRYLHGEVKVP